MTPFVIVRWREIAMIVDDALELPTEERPAFVQAACGRDPALRREVGYLLAHLPDEAPVRSSEGES